MISLTNLFTILLPLSATVALSSHLPPPIKRAGHHDKARKNFQHIHSNENNSTLVSRGTTYTGTGTFYYTGLGACGQYSQDSDYMVALNSAQYGSGYPGPQCFKGITIQANGNTVSGVTIMDECPTCGYGSLDLSPGLFKQFASEDAGVISITWWFNDDSSEATTTSQTPTSTYVAPTSTYTPPTSTWVEPTSTYTPPTSTWTPPASSSVTTTSQAAPSSITSTSAAISSSTITSSALSSTASSIIAHNTTNPYVVISSNSTAASVTAGVTTDGTDGEDSEGSEGVSVTVTGNIEGLNGLVAQYGQLVVVAAEAA